MNNRLVWPIMLRAAAADPEPGAAVPAGIVTAGARFHHENMPEEVAMLLPTSHGSARLIDDVIDDPSLCAGAMLGLFLAGPFLNVALESTRLQRAEVRWITNLPSVAQQDLEFSRQLTDVGLDLDRELECLAQFRSEGFRTAAVVADAQGATAAAAINPDAMIVLPRVVDFAAGFPSLRQRSTAVQLVAGATQRTGWSGILLGLGQAGEAESEGLWPAHLDGLVCRPTAA